jgi:hypothetical protein
MVTMTKIIRILQLPLKCELVKFFFDSETVYLDIKISVSYNIFSDIYSWKYG